MVVKDIQKTDAKGVAKEFANKLHTFINNGSSKESFVLQLVCECVWYRYICIYVLSLSPNITLIRVQYKQDPNVRVEPYPPLGEAFFQKLSIFRKDIGSMASIRMLSDAIIGMVLLCLCDRLWDKLFHNYCFAFELSEQIDAGGYCFLQRMYFSLAISVHFECI